MGGKIPGSKGVDGHKVHNAHMYFTVQSNSLLLLLLLNFKGQPGMKSLNTSLIKFICDPREKLGSQLTKFCFCCFFLMCKKPGNKFANRLKWLLNGILSSFM